MKYKQEIAGAWVQPIRRGYKMACCDCGLVHRMDFRIYGRHIQFRAFRENRSTALVRRHKDVILVAAKRKFKPVKRPGALTKKAKAAHMGVQAYARKHKNDKGLTGKQSRFALTAKKWKKK